MNLGTLVGYLNLDSDDFDKGLDGALGRVKDFGAKGAVIAAAAGAAIAGAVGAAVVGGMNIEAANDKLAAQLGAGSPLAEAAGQVAGHLYAQAYGDSLSEVNEAVRQVLQNGLLPEDATNAQIEAITGRVMDLAKTFDQDLGGTTNAVAQMIRTGLADNAGQALDVLTRGFQQGDDKAGDLLDTFNEYGVQFQKLGLDGTAAMGLISQAIDAGARDSDVAADALKEFAIRAVDGSKLTAQGFQMVGMNADDMAAKIAAGGPTATDALGQVLDGLRNIEDPAMRAQAATALFGTQAEDLGAALYAMDTTTAVQSMGNVAGAADKMGAALNDNASTNIESFKRQAQLAFVEVLGGKVLPFVNSAATTLATQFGPAVKAVGGFLSMSLVPALQSAAQWMAANQTPLTIVAALITAVFLPALIAMGVQSTIAAAKTVAAFVMTQAGAVASVAVQSAQIAMMVLRWAAMAGAAVLNAGLTVGAWIGMGIAAVAQAAIVAAAWVGARIRTVASLVMMAAGFAVQGAVMVSSMAATAAGVVAGWVVMGVQSMIQAARMAAAWFIALGPVGWVTAAVIGLVALIIANWDRVVGWTKSAWSAVSGAVSGAWNTVTGAVSSGVSSAVSWVAGMPGRLLGALGNIGGLLVSAGADLIRGFINGIKNMAGNVASAAMSVAKSAVSAVTGFLGIHSPSRVFADLGQNVGQGFVNGIKSMQPAVAAQMQAMADYSAMQSLSVAAPAMASARAAETSYSTSAMSMPSAAQAAQGGIDAVVRIDRYYEAERGDVNATAHALAVLARTGGAG